MGMRSLCEVRIVHGGILLHLIVCQLHLDVSSVQIRLRVPHLVRRVANQVG